MARLLPQQLRSSFDEDDVVQDTLTAAWKSRAALEQLDSTELQTWLRTVARRKLIDRVRKMSSTKRQENKRSLLPDEIGATTQTPSSFAAQNESAELLEASLSQLSQRQRRVIRLRYFESKPFKEVADEMDVSVEAAQMLLNRAVVNLRKSIGRESRYFN